MRLCSSPRYEHDEAVEVPGTSGTTEAYVRHLRDLRLDETDLRLVSFCLRPCAEIWMSTDRPRLINLNRTYSRESFTGTRRLRCFRPTRSAFFCDMSRVPVEKPGVGVPLLELFVARVPVVLISQGRAIVGDVVDSSLARYFAWVSATAPVCRSSSRQHRGPSRR